MWKDFFYFSRTERQGITVLIVLIALVCITSWLIPSRDVPEKRDNRKFEKEYIDFMTSLKERKQQKKSQYNNRTFEKQKIILAAFDPNTADSLTFLSLGLPPWMAGNILHYRTKGGQFRKQEDFRKVYGLTEEQYTVLLPYISIAEISVTRDTTRLLSRRDTLQYYKYPTGTVISLNQADTTELKKIPGVGSAIARMIVGYRKQLGGYYKIEQLQDIHLSVGELRHWLSVGNGETRHINLNKAGIERLKAHPYINFYQAKAIVEYRKKKGSLQNLEQLKLYEEFTATDFERLKPYLSFE